MGLGVFEDLRQRVYDLHLEKVSVGVLLQEGRSTASWSTLCTQTSESVGTVAPLMFWTSWDLSTQTQNLLGHRDDLIVFSKLECNVLASICEFLVGWSHG